MRIYYTFFIFLCLIGQLDAQVKLQMDRFGKKKTMDFYEGEIITVRLKGEEVYQELEIKKLYPEANIILTQLGPIKIDDIERLRTFSNKGTGKYLSYIFWVFGASWGGYSLIAFLAFGEPLTWSVLFVMGISFLIGWILRRAMRRKTYKIGKKRKLRIFDMRIEPFRPKP
jgi:hypothetical protein